MDKYIGHFKIKVNLDPAEMPREWVKQEHRRVKRIRLTDGYGHTFVIEPDAEGFCERPNTAFPCTVHYELEE